MAHSAAVASAVVVVQVAASVAVAVASVVEAVAAVAAQAVVVDDLSVALFTSSIRLLII